MYISPFSLTSPPGFFFVFRRRNERGDIICAQGNWSSQSSESPRIYRITADFFSQLISLFPRWLIGAMQGHRAINRYHELGRKTRLTEVTNWHVGAWNHEESPTKNSVNSPSPDQSETSINAGPLFPFPILHRKLNFFLIFEGRVTIVKNAYMFFSSPPR